MLTKRLIACLDVLGDRVVKGVQFVNLRDAGDPVELAQMHAASGSDEIALLDIGATPAGLSTSLDLVRRTARELFIPFTVGGGIRSLTEAASVIEAGADKVVINSSAIKTPSLITDVAKRFGSQAVVVAIDVKRRANAFEVYISSGTKATGLHLLNWLGEAVSRGAGEILLTSIDRDGSGLGFDCELTAIAASATKSPVIASGGARTVEHFADVFQRGRADAALAASIFHFGIENALGLKKHLAARGVPVRFPC